MYSRRDETELTVVLNFTDAAQDSEASYDLYEALMGKERQEEIPPEKYVRSVDGTTKPKKRRERRKRKA